MFRIVVWSKAHEPRLRARPGRSPGTDLEQTIETTLNRGRRGLARAGGVVMFALLAACGGEGAGRDESKPFEFGDEEFGLTMKELVAKVEAVEQRIARCMADAGFEYVANDFETVRRAMRAEQSAPGLSEAEYRAEYGYGISTQPNKPSVLLSLGEQNSRIREGLGPGDQEAYDQTLYGDDREAVFANALEEEDFSRTGGCTRKAVEREFTKREMSSTYQNPADRLTDGHPRMVEAFEKFSACMEREGFSYNDPSEIDGDLRERYEAITSGEDPTSLAGPRAADLAELQAYERRVAQVANDCEDEHIDPVSEAVDREIFGRSGD